MQGHKHADLMAKAAKIAKTDMEWWRHFEVLAKGTTDNWYQLNSESVFHHDGIYRFVPQPGTIKIGDYDVPEPVREVPDDKVSLWVADTAHGAMLLTWKGCETDMRMFNCGILHLTKKAAEGHIAALLSFTKVD